MSTLQSGQGAPGSTVAFFVLAYAISWTLWSPLWLAELGWIDGAQSYLWHFAGAFGPLSSAAIVAAATSGRSGLKQLFGRLLRWRVRLHWWLFTLLFGPALLLITAAVMRVVNGDWLDFGQFGRVGEFPELPSLVGLAVWILTFGLGEETGWRGFALPRLQTEHSAMSATYIVGSLWALWHLPTFTYNYNEFTLFIFFGFAVGIMAGAVLLTSLFNSTDGSLLLCVLWHGIYNAAASSGDAEVSMVVTAGVILWAMYAGRRFGPATLAPNGKVEDRFTALADSAVR